MAVLALLATAVPAHAIAAPCWRPPVEAVVVDGFRRPACRWCPGNRGLEYDTPAGTPVRAVAAGEVTFAGSVAGVAYVVVEHGNGWRATYGNLAERSVARGDHVAARTLIGTTAGRLHFGLRDGDEYIDPAPYLGTPRGVVRLVPADGSRAAPAPPPRWVCAGSTAGLEIAESVVRSRHRAS